MVQDTSFCDESRLVLVVFAISPPLSISALGVPLPPYPPAASLTAVFPHFPPSTLAPVPAQEGFYIAPRILYISEEDEPDSEFECVSDPGSSSSAFSDGSQHWGLDPHVLIAEHPPVAGTYLGHVRF